MKEQSRSLLREPLLHFGILALVVFVAQAIWGSDREPEAADGVTTPTGPIVIDAPVHERLDADFEERYGRLPTDEEHQQLVEGAIERELLVREAFAMGLVYDDPVVRRRLLQKMEFVLGQTSIEPPTADELLAFYGANSARYAPAPRYDFVAVRVNTEDGPNPRVFAEEVRQDLDAGVDPKTLGDRVLHSTRFTPGRVSEQYGTDFTEALLAMETKTWTVVDAAGTWYVVELLAIEAKGDPSPFEEVRDRVEADWKANRRSAAFVDALAGLREKHGVEQEPRP